MKFKKEILQEGLYVVSDGKGGRAVQLLDRNRFDHWVKQAKAMKDAGLNIPAPDFHDPKAVPGERVGSKSNYGFWEDLTLVDTVDSSGNAVKAMEGFLDVPNEDDAKKIGTSVRETSIYAVPEFIDGHGNVWKDVLTHIAVVTKPIEPGQKNFIRDNGELAISMSQHLPISMSDVPNMVMTDSEVNVDDLYELLEKVAGICIPRTSPELMASALLNALRQKQLSEKNRGAGGTMSKPPEGSELYEVPVVMSNNNDSAASAVQKPELTPEIVMSHPAFKNLESQNQGLVKLMANGKKTELRNRLDALVKRNLISVEDSKDYLTRIDAIQMSFDGENEPLVPAVELQIQALEKVKLPASVSPVVQTGLPHGLVEMANPTPYADGVVDDARADEIVKNLFNTTN